jgi:WD40 repeat protein/tetratricopeptide (TPR) repeat protein
LEPVLERFEDAWRRGERPELEKYLTGDPEERGRLLVELVHEDLEYRLKAGEAARVEHYLRRYPNLADDSAAVLSLVAVEYEQRRRCEPGLAPDEFLRRFPRHAAELRRHWQVPGGPQTDAPGNPPAEQVSAGGWDQPTASPEAQTPRAGAASWPTIPGYEVLAELGRGGMGVVYKARQVRLGRLVALKMIRAGAYPGDAEVRRFRAEAETVARLQHPNIVQIFETGGREGEPYFAMELVEGGSLAARLHGKPQPPAEAARTVRTLARAVHAAHCQGVIHRDLKPGNVLLTPDGVPKVTDFSLAKSLQGGAGLTRTGSILGTPPYMAPEQAAGRKDRIGPCTDVYGLGAVLYEMLTGRPPFQGETDLDVLTHVLEDDPVAPRRLNSRVPRDLEKVCLKCLDKDRGRRYASAEALAQDLENFLDGKPVLARPAPWWVRAAKWARRRPAVATLCGVSGMAVAAVLLITLWWNARLQVERDHAQDARGEAERARHATQQTLINSYTNAGVMAADQGKPGEAALWFAKAAQVAKDFPDLRSANQIRVEAVTRQIPVPLRAVRHAGGFPQEILFHPSKEWLMVRCPRRSAQGQTTAGHHCTIWDYAHEEPVTPPGGASVLDCAWSPDGDWLAVGTSHKTLEFYRFPDLKLLWRLEHPGPVACLAFSPDGRYLALADHRVRVWSCLQQRFLKGTLSHPQPVIHLAFSGKGDRLATACADDRVRVFAVGEADGATGPLFAPVTNSMSRREELFEPVFIDRDRGLLTLTNPSQVAWRNPATGHEIRSVPFMGPHVGRAVPSPDGRFFAVHGDGGAQLWDIPSGQPVGQRMVHRHIINGAAFSPDGALLLTASADRRTGVWSVPGGVPFGPPIIHQENVSAIAFAPDGLRFATSQRDGLLRVWQLATAQPGSYALPLRGFDGFAVLSPDGRYFLPAGWNHTRNLRAARVFDVATGRPVGRPLPVDGLLNNASFSADGRKVVTVSSVAANASRHHVATARLTQEPGQVHFWDWRSGKRLGQAVATPSEPLGAAYSPDGRRAAVACAAGHVLLIDPATGRILGRGHHDPLKYVGYLARQWVRLSPGGECFVTWGLGESVCVWDTATGRLRYPPLRYGLCTHVDFSPDGRLLMAALYGTVRIWNLKTGRPAVPALEHPDTVWTARFDSSGDYAVTACRDGTARFWDWRARRLVCPPLEHKDEVFDANISPDGRWLFTASRDGTGRIWEARTGKPVGLPWLFGGSPYEVRVTPDGRRLLVAGNLDAVYVPDLEELSPPADGALEEDALLALAELIAGQTVHPMGGVVNLTSAEWLDRWRHFRRAHPGHHRLHRSASAWASWHRQRAVANGRTNHWSAALWHLDRFLELRADESALWTAGDDAFWGLGSYGLARAFTDRGEAQAGIGRWDRAVSDFDRAVRLGEKNPELLTTSALAHLQVGDLPGYRGACDTLLERFSSQAPETARFVKLAGRLRALNGLAGIPGGGAFYAALLDYFGPADHLDRSFELWACLITPDAVSEPGRVVLALGQSLARQPGNAILLSLQGRALYRAGRYDAAVRRLNEAIRAAGPGGHVEEWLFLAMAHHRLGHGKDARSYLHKAVTLIDKETGGLKSWAWQNRLGIRVLRREAQAVLLERIKRPRK